MSRGLRALALAVVLAGMMPAHAETIRITIDKLVFSPADVAAKVGDRIEWVNKDILAHTATAAGLFDVMIPAKKTGAVIVKKPGDIEYYCRFHPNMKGRIAVAPN
jgi:plastocyanin